MTHIVSFKESKISETPKPDEQISNSEAEGADVPGV